jgi:hypothetical protein
VLDPDGAIAPISVVAFSLSKPDVILDRGTWARERRERGRVAAESGLVDIMAASTRCHNQLSMIDSQNWRGLQINAGRVLADHISCNLHVPRGPRRVDKYHVITQTVNKWQALTRTRTRPKTD